MCLNVSVVKLCLYVSECVCSKIIKELPGVVGSGTPCIWADPSGRGVCGRPLARTAGSTLASCMDVCLF